jgi:hypothetical protein
VNRLIVIPLPEGLSAEKLTKPLAMNRLKTEERDLKNGWSSSMECRRAGRTSSIKQRADEPIQSKSHEWN